MTIEIANRLIELRKNKGLSQEELAEKIGISRQAVSKWERAESSPDIDNIIMLSRLYGISVDELLCNENETSMDVSELELEKEPEPEETIGSADGITRLEIAASANIDIVGTDEANCSVNVEGPEDEKKSLRVFKEGDTLNIIQDGDENFWERIFSVHRNINVTVRLPRRMESIDAKLKGGSINSTGVNVRTFEAKSGGGRVSVADCSIGGLELRTGGGSIFVRGVRCKSAELWTGGGGVKAEGIDVSDRLEAKTGGGSIVVSGSALETEATSGGGDVRLTLAGAERIEAKTGGGGVAVELSETEGVTANLATGGGKARLMQNGELITSGKSVTASFGTGKTVVNAKSGGGSVTVNVIR